MNTEIIKLPARVYYVSSPDDDTVLVALDVQIRKNVIRWFDTVKERVMEIAEVIKDDGQEFSFKRGDNSGEIYTLKTMTIEDYNEKVKKRLIAPKEFSSEEELCTAFEETKKNAW